MSAKELQILGSNLMSDKRLVSIGNKTQNLGYQEKEKYVHLKIERRNRTNLLFPY